NMFCSGISPMRSWPTASAPLAQASRKSAASAYFLIMRRLLAETSYPDHHFTTHSRKFCQHFSTAASGSFWYHFGHCGGFMPRNINAADKKASLWRIMPFLRPYSWTVANGLFTNILARIFELLPFAIIGEIVDRLNTGQNTQGSWFAYQALLIFGTFVGLALFQSLSDYCWTLISQKVRHDLRVKIYDHLQRLEASFFEERHTGDLMSVIVSDIDNLEGFFADAITAIIRIIITFAGTYAILFFRDWRLALLLFAPLPFVLVAIRYFAISIQPKYKKARLSVGVINSIVENNLSGMGVIQAYTAEEFQSRRVRGSSEEYRDASIKAGIDRAKFIPVIYAIAGLAYAGLIGFGALLTFGQN
ncbi:ABC transporter ATP-binding protein, partial [bacterium]